MVIQQEIPYELAPFGKFPYGREMFGYLGIEQSSACQPFELQKNEQEEDYSQMLIVEEGDCNIKQKTLNVEHSGAKLLIIIRKQDQSHDELSSNTKDLVNFNVEIPAITVDNKTGYKLKNMINTQGKILIKFQMPIPQSEVVYVDIMMKQNETKMYDFLTSIKNHILQFENKLQLTLNFLPDDQTSNENKAELQIRTNCVNYEYIFDLLQIYKQECIKKNKFDYSCFSQFVNGLDPEQVLNYKACVQRNQYKVKDIQQKLESHLQGSKSHILINGKTFHGSVNPENVFEAICGAYASSPKSCLFLNNKYSVFMKYSQYKRNAGKHKFLIHFLTLSLTLFLLTMAGIAIHLAYEKVYKRFLSQNVQKIVHESMSNYQSIKNNE